MSTLPAEQATQAVPLLQTRGLTKRFDGVTAVENFAFELNAGETLGVIGPNGAGKSTLISMLSGAQKPTAGEIFFEGRDVTGMAAHRLAQLGIGRTHQIPQPFGRMTVLDNLMLGRIYAAGSGFHAARRESLEILELTGLAGFADVEARQLALLRLKRLELARALSTRPRVLLLDEIGAGLVEQELRELIELIKALRNEVEAILVVEHVIDVIRECSDRVLVLDWGKKLTEGTPEQVLGDERVAAVYLGTGTVERLRQENEATERAAAAPLLELRNVSAAYGSFRALHDVTLAIHPGEAVTLLGANGAGKTTTARVISGMLPAAQGQVLYADERIDGKRPHTIVRLGIAHCMEGRRIFSDLSVEENLLLGGRTAGSASELHERLTRVYDLFDVLQDRRDHSGSNLSGGQQQMLAIGRALMASPNLVIFDEISLGLAPVVVDAIYEKLAELREQGVAMLLIEQNVERGLALADYAYVLEKGVVALSGLPAEIRTDPRLRALYVGEAKGDT